MKHLAAPSLALALAAGISAAAERPPVGVAVDEIRTVRLPAKPPENCMSLATNGVTLLLDKAKFEAQAGFSLGRQWQTEEERLAFIAANRAKALLAQLTGERDARGCERLKPGDPGEAIYPIAEALEAGSAAVALPPDGQLLETIRVHYLAFRAGPHSGHGDILFILPDSGRMFWQMPWWAS